METKINLEVLQLAVNEIRKMNLKNNNIHMAQYRGIQGVDEYQADCKIANNQCNTIACYLGWFPFILHPTFKTHESDFLYSNGFSYGAYCERVLELYPIEDHRIWSFLFSAEWTFYDNTLEGALQRSQYLIDNPSISFNYEYEDFMKNWWKKQ
jgi:hypothetical protein